MGALVAMIVDAINVCDEMGLGKEEGWECRSRDKKKRK